MTSPRLTWKLALATALLVPLALPVAAAEEPVSDAVGVAEALLGCTQHSYDKAVGEIYVGVLREPWRVVKGFWQDGCGGKGCDDSVSGETPYGSFSIVEAGPSQRAGFCLVRCIGFGYNHMAYGNVVPKGSSSATFACTFYPGDPTFMRGTLKQATQLNVFVEAPDPLPDVWVD